MADRIIDDRTDEPCDYARLLKEVDRRSRTEGGGWTAAAKLVAKEANPVSWDAILHALYWHRRKREPAAKPRRRRKTSAMALGLGGLLTEIEVQVREVSGRLAEFTRFASHAFSANLSRELDPLREMLEDRQRALREAGPEKVRASLARALGEDVPPTLDVRRMIATEDRAIEHTLGVIRDCQKLLLSWVGPFDDLDDSDDP